MKNKCESKKDVKIKMDDNNQRDSIVRMPG
jgi:hypothetical protein